MFRKATPDDAQKLLELMSSIKGQDHGNIYKSQNEIVKELSDQYQSYWIVGSDTSDEFYGTFHLEDEGEYYLAEYPYMDSTKPSNIATFFMQIKELIASLDKPVEISLPLNETAESQVLIENGFVLGQLFHLMIMKKYKFGELPQPDWSSKLLTSVQINPSLDEFSKTWRKTLDKPINVESNDFSLWSSVSDTETIYRIGLYLESEIIGVLLLCIHENEGEIKYLGIKPEFRRRGFGKLLFLYGCQYLIGLDVDELYLGVDEVRNGPAFDMYKKLGFSIGDSWKRFHIPNL